MALDGTLLRRFAFLMSDRKTVNGIHSIVMGYQIILNTKYPTVHQYIDCEELASA